MDKIAANNHFVTLRKELKKAKAMVTGNLVRKINKLKQDKEEINDEEQIKKVDNKIERIHDEIKLLKTIDSYEIAKKATRNTDLVYWNKLISDSKAKTEDILTARVITKNNVQKQVAKFRNDHKDYDEWLNEYIEYREKKRELISTPRQSFKPDKSKRFEKTFGTKREGRKGRDSERSVDLDRKPLNPNSRRKSEKRFSEKGIEDEKGNDNKTQLESLHPSWESKRKEKELLKAAFSGQIKQPNKVVFNS